MMEAKCSLLIQQDGSFDPRQKELPKQRVLVYQDRGYNPDTNSPSPNGDENFYVDFNGCKILQFEPSPGTPQRTMPITLTVGGKCIFTPENFQDFNVMMRTKEQSIDMKISPNGNFDWPDVQSLLMCPLCGRTADVPQEGDDFDHVYWLLFYPLLQITIMKGSQMTLGTRTICRLTCIECMEDLIEDMTLNVCPPAMDGRRRKLSFSLPARQVLDEAGSASFLEDGPPRPETHPHVDDLLDAWTLYNLWEHSGAWEALQNDYKIVLSRSMHSDNGGDRNSRNRPSSDPRSSDRSGKSCGNPSCEKIHGETDPETGEQVNLCIRCKQCRVEYYCSRTCREEAKKSHEADCLVRQEEKHDRRDKNRLVKCDTCGKQASYKEMKRCGLCHNATYCNQECQQKDWERHKKECQPRKR
jgi:hypothetical protein